MTDVARLERELEQAKASQALDLQFPETRLLRNGEERILATIDNLRALMAHYKIEARYNVIQKRISVSGINTLPGEEENSLHAELQSRANRHGLPDKGIAQYLERIAQLNAYNPVTDWLETLTEPDGEPISEFVAHCRFTEREWAEIACRRWFVQAVAAADHAVRAGNPLARPEFPYVLTIAGPQGLTKTALMYDLLPPPVSENFTAGRLIDTNRRDSIFEALQNWIIELGEIDSTFRKSDIAALKAFLTKQTDDIRLPYARGWSRMPRRTCYFATVNQLKFLRDTTGNRRFWPVEIQRRIEPLPRHLPPNLWAWAWHAYLKGEQWWLTQEEERVHGRIVAQYEDKPMQETLLDCYDFDRPERDVVLTSTEVLQEMGWPQADRGATTALGMLLREVGIEKNARREYRLPPRTGANRHNL